MLRVLYRWLGVAVFMLAIAPVNASPPPVSTPAQQPPVQSSENLANQLFKQGIHQYQTGQLLEAVQSWQQALSLYQQQPNPMQVELTLENLGLGFQRLGDYNQAITHFQQQLSLAQQAAKDSAQEPAKQARHLASAANASGNLGSIYRMLGNYVKALEFTQQALQIRRDQNDRRGEGLVLANLGNIEAELGKYETAIDLHQQSLKIAQEVGNKQAVVISLNSLGAIHASQGKYDEARRAYEQSLTTAQEIDFRLAMGSALNNLGSVLHTQGNYQQAVKYYQQSLAVAQKFNDPRMLAAALSGLGLGYTSLQDYSKAIEYQQQGLDMAKKLGNLKLEGITSSNLGYTLWRSGNLAAAEKQLRDALNALESLRLNLDDPDKVSIIDTQLISYNMLQQVLVAQNQIEDALEISERSRARAFVELLARRLEKRGKGLQAQENTLPQKTSKSTVESITVDQIRQIARTQNATLVEYAIATDAQFVAHGKLHGKETYLFIWVIQPSGKIDFRQVDLQAFQPSERSLAELVTLTRNCLYPIFDCRSHFPKTAETPPSNSTPHRRKNPALHRLHQLLIEPIADLLPTDPDAKVVFMPQESLFLVPFPALQDRDGTYLIENHTLLTAPAIQVLALTNQARQQLAVPNRPPSQRFSPALIVGNPTMPVVDGTPLDPLPLAEAEAKAIGRLLASDVLLGSDATYQTVVRQMTQARLVHLATHGLLEYGQDLGEADVPGAIALAPKIVSATNRDRQQATASEHNGLLTASEILDLRLQAEMVVLSACDTGRGRITGDGVIGLSRAFISAGVPSVVVSLWAVPDMATSRLMVAFYQKLQQQPDKAKALRLAMLETMKAHSRPVEWAAFTLIGEAE